MDNQKGSKFSTRYSVWAYPSLAGIGSCSRVADLWTDMNLSQIRTVKEV